MFGRKKKEVQVLIDGLLDIISISNDNVLTLQEAVENLGGIVTNMGELIEIQEARINMLEGVQHDRRNNET